MGEGKTLSADDEEELCLHFIHAVHETTGISSQSSHTRRQLQKGSEWDEWLEAEHKQLDDMADCDMYDDPVLRSSLPKGAVILNPVWSYRTKRCGRKKACNCCNAGSLKKYGVDAAKHFAACISQTGMKLLTSI